MGGFAMNKVYGCLFMVLLLCLATTADLLAYITVGGTFFVVGAFVLGGLLLLSVFLYGSSIGSLFSLALFGITLLTGVILFNTLLPANGFIFGLLLFAGIVGFVCTLLCSSCSKTCKKMCAENSFSPNSSFNTDMPPMPLPATPLKTRNGKNSMRVSTYNIENPEVSSLATMEALDELSDNDADDDFVDLKDLENMMEKKKVSKKVSKKTKRK